MGRKWNTPEREEKRRLKFELERQIKEDKKRRVRISKQKGYKAFMVRKREIKKLGNGGSHTFADWENLKAQYNWTCPSCKKIEPEIKLSQDHIISISKGGSNNIENIQPLCISCNSKKHTKIIKYDL